MSQQIILEVIKSSFSIFAVNFTYWRADFELAILFFDFSLGSKCDIPRSFGTFLAEIGGFFLNDLTKHFNSNLPSPTCFCSHLDLPERNFSTRYPFFFTFLFVQNVTLLAVLAHFQHILEFSFLNQLPNRFGSNLFLSFSFFLTSLSFLLTFFLFKQLDLRQSWHISSTLLEVLF